ncbi:MAG: hypoxanthine phosphoribosyltransferase [Actinobacteria bacterium]|jgi:hypoxanthine phosphoribosyltransferase|nr:hypoxanthine phosphoribosyltransferase [Actinomycetota bacterium]
MDAANISGELTKVLLTEKQILERVGELAAEVEKDYKDQDLLLVGVLKGAIVLMSDFSRAMDRQVEIEWMAVSSYGSGTKSSGVVRILKDLDADVTGRNILVIEDILDSGLTLSWLRSNLESRGAKSVEILTLLRKPEAVKVEINPKYVGFDIPTEFVVGYGLDYSENYRNLRDIAVLSPHIYS